MATEPSTFFRFRCAQGQLSRENGKGVASVPRRGWSRTLHGDGPPPPGGTRGHRHGYRHGRRVGPLPPALRLSRGPAPPRPFPRGPPAPPPPPRGWRPRPNADGHV
ncbi:proline-rich protein 2-like [Meleagris gallopavo]|uniref:proline-rich protein 2-like n=1 Tax=Meleagris gallopavo TaxID=9103 RepID=UPI00093A4FCD|nr:proline-rich protein 2-like [Meleagris gallopavo]